ncbi:MAG: MBL fold metallo-hydrolase [Clostridiales bacterium]|jgi:glyoxylase-like metal-dependent hydrolase (beta-lactamase superfamily II)|nr:MBL fold metallo-hydrolase [Clostridiales bacterium]
MKIFLIVTKEYDQNCYCCFDPDNREGVLIDPGLNEEGIFAFLEEAKIIVKAILFTHGHYDHIMSAEKVRAHTSAPILAHSAETELLYDPYINLSGLMARKRCSLTIDKPLEEGDEIKFGQYALRVIYTPGHTAGGICYYSEPQKVIFTGDTMFWESVGRTDLPQGDGQTLTHSINEKLLTLPKETIVYPGHGRPTDIGHEILIHSRVNMFEF